MLDSPGYGRGQALSAAAVGVAGLLSLAMAIGIGRFAFTPMLPLMIRDGQLDLTAGGWLAAANYVGYLAGALTAGRLPVSAPRLALTALLLTAVLTAAMALPLGPFGWAALRLVAGCASAWAFVSTSVWCLQALAQRPNAGGAASGWTSGLYAGVGSGIALTGLYLLAGASAGAGASSLWWQMGVLSMVLALPAAWVIRQLGRQAAAAAAAQHATLDTAARPHGTLAFRGAYGLIVSYGLFGFGYILPATFLPVMARSIVDDPRLFGLAWPVFGATAAASTLLASWWLRRATRVRVWAVSQALMGVGVLLPSLWLSGWTVGISALLVGSTFMVVTLAGVQETRARAGATAPRALARMTTAFAIGQIAGPVAANLLLSVPALEGSRALDVALQLGAAGLLASAVWLWRTARAAHAPGQLHGPLWR